MRREPAIDHAQLAQALYSAYRIEVLELTFIPVGFAAACYRLQCSSGRYFLKLWPTPESNPARHLRRRQALRLTRALYERDIYPRVTYPLPTATGALMAGYAGGEFALFPFWRVRGISASGNRACVASVCFTLCYAPRVLSSAIT